MPTYEAFPFDNSFVHEMEGFFVAQEGDKAPDPELILFNENLAKELGLDARGLNSKAGAMVFSGSEMPEGAASIAQVYAGHQFGGFSPQLGDGRALMIGEVIDQDGRRQDIQLKGSGRTPFSRGGDGKAVLGPVLREYLMGEAMHGLGVATTRALAAVMTGEQVVREDLEKGAVLTRVASSHLRVGTFQFFAARGETDKVKKLADYAIARHYPELVELENPYLEFLKAVMDRQASLIAKWVSIGFIHGVMNTDNMTISGETIDYGPCAFIDHYDPKMVFSSIDEYGRYAYGNQPNIGQWNLARLAETLIPIINPDDSDAALKLASDAINGFPELYQEKWLAEMRLKFGLYGSQKKDVELINQFYLAMDGESVDYTKAFRSLSKAALGNNESLLSLLDSQEAITGWLKAWQERLVESDMPLEEIATNLDQVNPIYIPRNHKVEEALEVASRSNDLGPFKKLQEILANPYVEQDGADEYAEPAPKDSGPHITYCGT